MPVLWRRAADASSDAQRGQLAPILIATADVELVGHVAPTGQRITDMLLRGQDLAFLPSGAPEEPANWITIGPTEILFVAPPPLATTSGWRADRNRREVTVRVGPYRVRGTAHLAPEADDVRGLRATQPFLPLTQARVRREASDHEEPHEVVIVNLTWSVIADS